MHPGQQASAVGRRAKEFGRTLQYDIKVAALDTTMDDERHYDTLVLLRCQHRNSARAVGAAGHRPGVCAGAMDP